MSSDPWGNASTAQEDKASSIDWSAAANEPVVEEVKEFDILNPFQDKLIPFDDWTNTGIDWLVENFREVFLAAKVPIDVVLKAIETFLLYLNPYVVILFFVLMALQFSTKKLAVGTFLSFMVIGLIGVWEESMITLALVVTAVLFSILIGSYPDSYVIWYWKRTWGYCNYYICPSSTYTSYKSWDQTSS
jgi:glycine betaine/proline transport system permease protein